MTTEQTAERHARSMGRSAARVNASIEFLHDLWRCWCAVNGLDVAVAWHVAVDAYYDVIDAQAN